MGVSWGFSTIIFSKFSPHLYYKVTSFLDVRRLMKKYHTFPNMERVSVRWRVGEKLGPIQWWSISALSLSWPKPCIFYHNSPPPPPPPPAPAFKQWQILFLSSPYCLFPVSDICLLRLADKAKKITTKAKTITKTILET